ESGDHFTTAPEGLTEVVFQFKKGKEAV
ncbi:hypothetical protein LCGC14_0521250, partial [marine sediment metagenome]